MQKKAELIKLENGIKLPRQTTYYHESKYSESFITQKEKNLQKIINETNIEPSGIYHHDEEYLYENGTNIVRLAIIDAVNNLIINNQVILQEDFDNEFMEIFLKYSLEGLPKKILITDGHTAYPPIIERICMKQQLSIFHIIKNHHDQSYKIINKLQRRIKSLETKIDKNEERILRIKNKSKGIEGKVSKNDITCQNRIKTRKKLEKQTRQLRRDLSEKRKELYDQERITERIRAIYDTDNKKAAKQRFNKIYNKINQFDKKTQNFLKTLEKKFDKTTEYHKNGCVRFGTDFLIFNV